jgi:hypothetical protein
MPSRRRPVIAAILLALSTLAAAPSHAAVTDGVAAEVAKLIPSADVLLGASTVGHGGAQALHSVYLASGNGPLWIREGTATPQAEAVLHELQNAESYGLDS